MKTKETYVANKTHLHVRQNEFREKERERETERHTGRSTDRQIDRQRERDT